MYHMGKTELRFATMWRNLKDILLREIGQTKKDKNSPLSLPCEIYQEKSDS